MMFYSKTTGGFYRPHDNVPEDAVEVPDEEYVALFTDPSKRIAPGADGRPILVEPPPPTDEEMARQVRMQRDAMLVEADASIKRLEDKAADVSAWRKHRQLLRDVPQQSGFPKTVTMPTPPADDGK